ncbi:MAG: Hsp70 family protein, partial [Alphaproteobacteria bacterium]|nr:Hsp70 family protein [Alphaproteobacteria bacterium]
MFTVGIDLGTTTSVVAYIEDGAPKIVEVDGGKITTPSVVSYVDGHPIVGREAILNGDSSDTLFSMKRLMGSNEKVAGKSAVEVSADILSHLKRITEAKVGKQIDSAIITVPAHFSDLQRTATKQAASIAGIKVLRLINEPTAAALAFGIDKNKNGIFAVYDFGGGTFDFSVLRLVDGIFQVLATGGDNYLGGDDIDNKIVEYNLQKYGISRQGLSEKDVIAARLVAKLMKEQLSGRDLVHKKYIYNGQEFDFELTANLLKQFAAEFIQKTLDISTQVLKDAKIQAVDGVVLAGGMTKSPLVKLAVRDFFKAQIYDDLNPEGVVAIGAAIQADGIGTKNKNLLLIDVVPLTLGIETVGGAVDKIIHRNTPIPIVERREYTTYQDNQTGIKFQVVQGERALAKDCRSLATFELTGIPPMPAGMPRVIVEFGVDVNGLLNLKAYEKTLGISQTITVEPSSGLSNDEMVEILQKAFENAEKDAEKSKEITIQIECERMLKFWESLLNDLPEQAHNDAEQKLKELSNALKKKDFTEIVKLKTALENI